MHQGYFAGIHGFAEHAFAEKRRPQRDAVEPAHQGVVLPGFDAMGPPHLVEFDVETDDFFVDPGFRPVRRRLGAAPDDFLECRVAADIV